MECPFGKRALQKNQQVQSRFWSAVTPPERLAGSYCTPYLFYKKKRYRLSKKALIRYYRMGCNVVLRFNVLTSRLIRFAIRASAISRS